MSQSRADTAAITYDFDVEIIKRTHVAEVKVTLWRMDHEEVSADLIWDCNKTCGYWESDYEIAACVIPELEQVQDHFGAERVKTSWTIISGNNTEKLTYAELKKRGYKEYMALEAALNRGSAQ